MFEVNQAVRVNWPENPRYHNKYGRVVTDNGGRITHPITNAKGEEEWCSDHVVLVRIEDREKRAWLAACHLDEANDNDVLDDLLPN